MSSPRKGLAPFLLECKDGIIVARREELQDTYFAKYLRPGSFESKNNSVELKDWSQEVIKLYLYVMNVKDYVGKRFEKEEPFNTILCGRVELLLPHRSLEERLKAWAEYTQDEGLLEAMTCAQAYWSSSIPDNWRDLKPDLIYEISRWLALGNYVYTDEIGIFLNYVADSFKPSEVPWVLYTLQMREYKHLLPDWGLKYVRRLVLNDWNLMADIYRMPNLEKLELGPGIRSPERISEVLSSQGRHPARPKLTELTLRGSENKDLGEILRPLVNLEKLHLINHTDEILADLPYPEKLKELYCGAEISHVLKAKLIHLEHLIISKPINLIGLNPEELTLRENAIADRIPPSVKSLNVDLGRHRKITCGGESVLRLSLIDGQAELARFPNLVELTYLWSDSDLTRPPRPLEGVKTLNIHGYVMGSGFFRAFPDIERLTLEDVNFEGPFDPLPKLKKIKVIGGEGLERKILERQGLQVEWEQ